MKTKRTSEQETNDAIERIASTILGVETLATQNMDRLDFHEVSVWQLKKALEAAYALGRASK